MDNRVCKHEIEIDLTAGVERIICCLLPAIYICWDRMGSIFDLGEIGEERIQIFLVVELQFGFEDPQGVIRMGGARGRNFIQSGHTGRSYGNITSTQVIGVSVDYPTHSVEIMSVPRRQASNFPERGSILL